MPRIANCAAGICLLLAALTGSVEHASAQGRSIDLSQVSLEDLTQMQISVSSFARKDEDLWKTPAAVFVITKEDIARSSVTSIPELLRMVPGMQVAQIDAASWAISARGFNSEYAGKLLVLVDGRTVYSEIYSGAHWDQIDIPLEDIERIEVIRGPGAAVWGTNAVNGVINIITKRTRNTLKLQLTSSVSRIGDVANIRYGASLGQHAQYRLFASYVHRNPLDQAHGGHTYDGENTVRGGGRVDWQRTPSDWITTSGEVYNGHLKQANIAEVSPEVGPTGQERDSMSGGYLLSRWEHKNAKTNSAFQVYYDEQSRFEISSLARTRTLGVDYQDHAAAGRHHDLVWGGEFRLTDDHLAGKKLPTTLPDYRNYLIDGFIQDEVTLIPGRLMLTLGSKVQDGTLAGVQIQPSVRGLWSPGQRQILWAAVSHAVIAPSIQDQHLSFDVALGTADGLPILGTLDGNPNIKPETVLAYEVGYRQKLLPTLNLDVATFINDNLHIQSVQVQDTEYVPLPSPHIETSLGYTNGPSARSAGVEATLGWKPQTQVSLLGSYTWLQVRNPRTQTPGLSAANAWNTPRHTATATASWTFAPHWSASSFIDYVGNLPGVGELAPGPSPGSNNSVPSYLRVDMHVMRELAHGIAIGAGGTNLLTPRHLEFGTGTGFIASGYVPRGAFIKAKWNF